MLLAEQVALNLNLAICDVLGGQGGTSGSTPRKSARLKPYETTSPPPDAVLLIDDVASSGRHLELAAAALREAGASVHAIAWIGNKRAGRN